MSKIEKMMSFDEFRAAAADAADPSGEVVRRQLEHLRDDAAADELLKPEVLEGGLGGWIPWDDARLRTAH